MSNPRHLIVMLGILSVVGCRMTQSADHVTPTQRSDVFSGTEVRQLPIRPSGKMVSKKGFFVGNEKVGERIFFENGSLAMESIIKNGQLDGIERCFYQSGKVFSETPYKHGVIDGTVRFYDENGEILSESTLLNGTGLLRQIENRPLVLVDELLPYNNGKIEGTMYTWLKAKSGKYITCIGEYRNGESNGMGVTISEHGKLISSVLRRNGHANGVFRKYISDGIMEAGYPKYYLDSQEVQKDQFETAAKTDPELAKSLNDDLREWGLEQFKKVRR